MENIFISTDWHLYSNETNSQHPYRSRLELTLLQNNIGRDMMPGDLWIHLGDLCDPEVANRDVLHRILEQIPATKVLVRGNHDTADDQWYLDLGFDHVTNGVVIHNMLFTHKPCPVPKDWINVHGHIHFEKIAMDGTHINAYATNWNDTCHPVLLDDLLKGAAVQKVEVSNYKEEKYRKYFGRSLEGTEDNRLDLTDQFKLYPVDEGVSKYVGKIPLMWKTPAELKDWMHEKIKYDPEEDNWRLRSPAQVLKELKGNCHDQAYFAKKYLELMGKKCDLFFMIEYKGPVIYDAGSTHTLVTYTDNDGKLYWFENAWADESGINGPYRNINELKKDVQKRWTRKPEYPKFYFGQAIPVPNYGMTLEEYSSWNIPNDLLGRPDSVDEAILFPDVDTTKYFEADDNEYKKKADKASVDQKADSVVTMDESAKKGPSSESLESITKYDRSFKGKGPLKLDSFKRLEIAAKDASKYTDGSDMAKFLSNGPADAKRIVYVDRNGKPVATYGVYDKPNGVKRVWALEVTKPYRGHGLSHQLVQQAIDMYGINDLSVGKDNLVAKKLYTAHGFVGADGGNDTWEHMVRLDESAFAKAVDLKALDEALQARAPLVLYHGSGNLMTGDLVPMDSGTTGLHLFASDSYEFALCFAGKQWNDLEINQTVYNGVLYLTEIIPGKFQEKYGDGGFVYELPGEEFHRFNDASHEFITDVPVKPIKVHRLIDVLGEMKRHGVMLYHYPDLPPFIKNRKEYVIEKCKLHGISPAAEFRRMMNADDISSKKLKLNEFANAIANVINESSSESKVDPNHEQKGSMKLSDLKMVEVTKEYLRKHGKKGALRDAGPCNEYCKTIAWELNGKPIVSVGVGYPNQKEREPGDTYNWIGNLLVDPEYRGYGLGKQALEYAIKTLGGDALAVRCNNELAIDMYKKRGFKTSKDSARAVANKHANYYQMYLHEDIGTAVGELNERYEADPKELRDVKLNNIFISTTEMRNRMAKRYDEQKNGRTVKTINGDGELRGPWDRALGDIRSDDLWIHLGKLVNGVESNLYDRLHNLSTLGRCRKAIVIAKPFGNEWMTDTWNRGMLDFDWMADNIRIGRYWFTEYAYYVPEDSGIINIHGCSDNPAFIDDRHICVDVVCKGMQLDRPISLEELLKAADTYMSTHTERRTIGRENGRNGRSIKPQLDLTKNFAKSDALQ